MAGPDRTLRLLPRVFAGVGVVLLAVATWVNGRERTFVARAERAAGTVVDLSWSADSDGGGTYHPVVRYVTRGGDTVTFVSNVGSNPPSRRVGEAIEVLYDPADPMRAHTAGFFSLYIGSFVTGILALVFGGIGFGWLYLSRRARLRTEETRRTGRRVAAKVVAIERRTNIRVGARSPWRIVAQWDDGGEVHVAHSANLWYDPTDHVGETIDVYVDRNNPRRAVVDTDALPPPAG